MECKGMKNMDGISSSHLIIFGYQNHKGYVNILSNSIKACNDEECFSIGPRYYKLKFECHRQNRTGKTGGILADYYYISHKSIKLRLQNAKKTFVSAPRNQIPWLSFEREAIS